MSVSSEVKRTLVKSPPELWAELSDPAALARHLGELGEIRIVRTEPEQAVDWEAPQVSGTVRIEPSGWGTKVTLTAIRAVEPLPEEPCGEETAETGLAAMELDVMVIEPATEAGALLMADDPYLEHPPQDEWEAPTDAHAETALGASEPPATLQPEPPRGFFTRLFRRRKQIHQPTVAATLPAEPEFAPEPEIECEPEIEPESAIEPDPPATVEPEEPDAIESEEPDLAAELADLEEQTTAVLVAVLDRLGAAHHRPFSRA